MRLSSLLTLAGSCALAACSLAHAADVTPPPPGQAPPLPPRLPEGVPAFPGAWGGGMFTTGGRGGKVIEVTTLADDGPGSLRAAIAVEGPRIIVFRVAGVIELKSDIDVTHPDVTFAGQSAPGDGVCLAYASVNINTHNVILRHLRVRRGKTEGGQGSDNIGGNPEGQVIVDHCSTSWGMDENLSLYRFMQRHPGGDVKQPTHNVTVQWCISSEALDAKNHAFGGTWGGTDSTFHHNLFACNTGRNPSIGMGGEFDYRNNVVFNWRHRTMDGGDETSLINVINNYYKPGPATNDDMRNVIARIESREMYSPGNAFRAGDWYPRTPHRPGKWYVAGNIFAGNADVTANNWQGMISANGEVASATGGGASELTTLARVNTPFEAWPVAQQTAQEAYESVLAKAGATLPKRDAVDARVTDSVRTGKTTTSDGVVGDPAQVGGYPKYGFDPAAVPADGDHDGMPDAWEQTHKLNGADAADGPQDADGDGYTNVEECLNGTDPREKIDYRNLGNNVDTISG
jgi:pectate lyase